MNYESIKIEIEPGTSLPRHNLSRTITRSNSMGRISTDFLAVWGQETKARQACFDEKRVLTAGSETSTAALAARGLAYTCKKGKKADAMNQDNFHIYSDSKSLFLAVFDGHGPQGHEISNFVTNTMPKYITTEKAHGLKPLDAIAKSFKRTERDLEKYCAERNNKIECEMSGTTATVVRVQDSKLYIGHVGDSTAVLGTIKDGRIKAVKLTVDHKPTLTKEKKRIKAAGGEIRRIEQGPYRVFMRGEDYPGLAMSRALGDLQAHRLGVSHSAELKEHTLVPADEFIIVASDGLWEFVSAQEAVDVIFKYGRTGARIGAEALSKLAWSRWIKHEQGQVVDDITILVAYLPI